MSAEVIPFPPTRPKPAPVTHDDHLLLLPRLERILAQLQAKRGEAP